MGSFVALLSKGQTLSFTHAADLDPDYELGSASGIALNSVELSWSKSSSEALAPPRVDRGFANSWRKKSRVGHFDLDNIK